MERRLLGSMKCVIVRRQKSEKIWVNIQIIHQSPFSNRNPLKFTGVLKVLVECVWMNGILLMFWMNYWVHEPSGRTLWIAEKLRIRWHWWKCQIYECHAIKWVRFLWGQKKHQIGVYISQEVLLRPVWNFNTWWTRAWIVFYLSFISME